MPEVGFTDGDVVTAANLNQIEDQIVVTCTSTTRPTGTIGRYIFETDTERLMVYDGSSWRLAGGMGWNDFTPSWNNVTVGNGTPDGAWMYQSGGVLVRAQLTFGSTTSVSGVVSFGLPNSFTALSDGVRTVGATYCRDDSASTEPIGTVVVASGGAVGTPYANDNNVTATNPFTWATDDIIACTVFVPQ